MKPNSGLIAADPKSVDRKLCDAKRVFRARFSLDGAATRAAESGEGGHSTTVVTVNDTPSRDFAHILHFHLAIRASRRIARRSGVYGDRAERLNPNISRVNSSNAVRAANAVAPNLPPPPEERRPVSETQPLYQWKYRRCRRGAPPCRHADRRLQWRFLQFRACAPPRILGGDDVWRIDRLLTQKLYRNGCITLTVLVVGQCSPYEAPWGSINLSK